MQNGNGSFGRGFKNMKPSTRYIIYGVAALLALWLIISFIQPGINGYFAVVAGVLLLIGNVRDLIVAPTAAQRSTSALFNSLIGGALVSFFLALGSFPPIGWLWYVPAVVLLLLAAPLVARSAKVYGAYTGAARTLADGARRVFDGVVRSR